MDFVPSRKVDTIKARLDHPVIDSDGHAIEFVPLVLDILEEQAGADAVAAYRRVLNSADAARALTPDQRRQNGITRMTWWGLPARNSLDRATAMFPALLAKRLPEMGIDHAIIYPTYGLTVTPNPDDDLRRALARAFNTYYAEAYSEHLADLTPVGIIPMHTPDEAIAELDHATQVLGLKAFMFGGPVSRPHPNGGSWVDSLAVDSIYDYDPVWQRCVELGVSPTFHTAAVGWGSRTSPSSYVLNHIGMFSAGGEAMARALFLGGVPHRFPELRVAFQEGGVAWAASLYSDLLGHWEKRNKDAVVHYDPKLLDRRLIDEMAEQFAGDAMRPRLGRIDEALKFLSQPEDELVDEFAATGVNSPEDLRELFTSRFHFGCEADDPLTALAFDAERLPLGARLKPVFASDVGHWDVPDIREVLPEAWELVEDGLATEADFRDLTYENALSLWAGSNPRFFEGTSVG